MTKHGGRYYLQYGAPGTEFNAYANGTYVSDKPLGPFTYADYNPIAYKPGGFVHGAGHGSTFQDALRQLVEHRHAVDRLQLDVRAADQHVPGQVRGRRADAGRRRASAISRNTCRPTKVDDPDSLFTGWMLLSYRKPATASSTMGEFAADRVTDENPRTFWVAAANKPGRDADGRSRRAEDGARGAGQFRRLQVGPLRRCARHLHRVRAAAFARRPDTGSRWRAPSRRGATGPNAYFELPQPVRARFIRYVHGHVGAANLAISDLRVFGNADGRAPATPARVVGSAPSRTSATRRSAGRRCRARSATTSASGSGPTG